MSQAGAFTKATVIPPGTYVETLTGNTGGAVGPDGSSNINILGTGGITVTGDAGDNTLTISGGGGSGVTTIDGDAGSMTGSTVTISGGTTGLTTTAAAATMDLTGTLIVSNGGTGADTLTGVLIGNGTSAVTGNTVTQHDVLVGGASNAITSIANGTTGQVFTASTGANPSWENVAASSISITGDSGGALNGDAFTFTGGTTGLTFAGAGSTETLGGTLIVGNGGTGATTFTSHGVLLGNTTGAVTATTAGTTGQVLTGVTGSAPTFQSPAASSITITGDSGGGLTGNSFTFTGGSTGLTFAGAGSTETVGGTLVVSNGGTGADTLTGLLLGHGTSTVTGITSGDYGVLISSSSGVPEWLANGTTGQVLTATTSGTPSWEDSASGGITTINGDTGNTGSSTTPTVQTDVASTKCGSSVSFIGDNTSTLTLNVTDSNSNILLGVNTGNGSLVGDGAQYNTAIGAGCFQPLTTGSENCAMGYGSLSSAATTTDCVSLGFESMITDTSSLAVVSVGAQALYQLNGASYTIGIGYQAGGNYTGTESNNIAINALSTTVVGENNVLRIGDGTGSGQQQLAAAYISGIDSVALTTANIVTESGNQLGTAVLTAGTNITIDSTSTPNQIIINGSGGSGGITEIDGNTGSSTGPTVAITTTNATTTFNYEVDNILTLDFAGDGNGNVILGSTSTYSGYSINTGVGQYVFSQIDSGSDYNCAFGYQALSNIMNSSVNNQAMGWLSQGSADGSYNLSIGSQALQFIGGQYNIAFGQSAGYNYNAGTESSNILINSSGITSENTTLRIGDGTNGSTALTAAFINGIDGVALTTANVVTEVGNQLGTAAITAGTGITVDGTSTPNQIIISITPSSERFKHNIQPLTDSSSVLNLQPVTFEYKPNQSNISKQDSIGTHYGLIAEEVHKVMPNLTFNDNSGQVTGVRYMEMVPLLLNEIQKLRKELNELKDKYGK